MSDRLRLVLVASPLIFGSIACGESSTPDMNNTSGSSSGGGGSGGAAGSSSAGTGGMAGAAGSSSAGMGGMAMAGNGGAGGAAGGAGGAGGSAGAGGSGGASANGTKMSFFVSSTPPGGPPGAGTGKFGGLAGGDAHCKMLAMAAGAVRTQWVAYLSVAGTNAKDRIGAGPWYNYDEDVFAADQAALHALPDAMAMREAYIAAKPADDLFMDENGMAVPSGVHDILTGTNPDGTVSTGNTCGDWTLDTGGMRMVGHSDTPANFSPSWNSAHASGGCDADSVESSGGEGRIYCFATD